MALRKQDSIYNKAANICHRSELWLGQQLGHSLGLLGYMQVSCNADISGV